MTEIKHISVQAAGNPNGSDGVAPITLYNNPQFEIHNDTHGGLNDNAYYFTIKIEKSYTIYKIIKNNVRSYQAIRGGYLAIAFSIPRGYELEGTTPYHVLLDLWKSFRDNCMTLKDRIAGTYEYNDRNIDKTALDEAAAIYTLKPSNKPYREMNCTGATAIVTASEDKIEQLLEDVHYKEFSQYSEIIIAESCKLGTNYVQLNISIPRKISFSIYEDNVLTRTTSDRNELIIVEGKKDPACYNNRTVSFTIQQLIDGDAINEASINWLTEEVHISTTNLSTPKNTKLHILVTKECENYFKENPKEIQIKDAHGNNIPITPDFCITLVGKQNIDPLDITISSNHYKYRNHKKGLNSLTINLLKIQQDFQLGRNSGNRRGGNSGGDSQLGISDKYSPVVDLLIRFKSSELTTILPRGSKELDIQLVDKGVDGKKDYVLSSSKIEFENEGTGYVIGHMYVPQKYTIGKYVLRFKTKDCKFYSKPLYASKDASVCEVSPFNGNKYSFYDRVGNKIIIPSLIALMFIFGFVTGYFLHDPIGGLFSNQDHTISEDSTGVIKNNAGSSVTNDTIKQVLGQAKYNFENRKDLSFVEIDNYFRFYSENSDISKEIDEKEFQNKVCNQINDYYLFKEAIVKGDVQQIKGYIELCHKDQFHVWKKHYELVEKVIYNEESKTKYMNELSNVKSFADFVEYEVYEPEPITYSCSQCDFVGTSKKQRETHINQKHKAAPSRFTCTICGANTWFNTQQELDGHMRSKHKNLER